MKAYHVLNLGCGDEPMAGAVNFDHRDASGVDVVGDAARLPFKDSSFLSVVASHVLEHVDDFGRVIAELHRILVPGGTLIAWVPYGIRSLYNPWHRRPFSEDTVREISSEGSTDLDRSATNWNLKAVKTLRVAQWHIKHYFNVRIGPKHELYFVLEASK